MLFRKDIPSSCSYCRMGTKIDDEQVLCTKRGVVSAYSKCRRFRYEPCKRVPVKAKAPDLKKFTTDDFSL